MKDLVKYEIYDGKGAIDEKHGLRRVSRWISIKHNYNPNRNNALYDYVMDEYGYKPYSDNFNPANGLYLDYFIFNGRNYAIEQFTAIGCIWDCIGHAIGYIENGETHYLSAFDSENYFNPLFIELDEYGERVRVYEEI